MDKLLSAFSETKDEILNNIQKIDISLKNIHDVGGTNPERKRKNSQRILHILYKLVDINCTLETLIVDNGFENHQIISTPENVSITNLNEIPSTTDTLTLQTANFNETFRTFDGNPTPAIQSSNISVTSNCSINTISDSNNQEYDNTVILDEHQTENNIEIPEKDYNIVETMEPNTQLTDNSSSSSSEATANRKLLHSNFRNRLKEAQRIFKECSVPEPFRFRPVDKSDEFFQQRKLSPKKKKAPNPTYELSDDILKAYMSCWISNIESPSKFYVRTNLDLYNTLQLELNDHINKKHFSVEYSYTSKEDAKTTVGDYCAAYIPMKSGYHRVHVHDWSLNDPSNIVHIYLVDTGEISFCHCKYLTILDDKFKEIPKLAIRCHFKALYPSSGDAWSEKARRSFYELTHIKREAKELYTIYVEKSDFSDSYAVDLCEKDSNNQSIATILIEKQLAIEKLLHTEDEEEEEEKEEIGKDVDYKDYNDDDVEDEEDDEDDLIEYDNINQAVTGYDARDEARICRFTNNNGTCFKGASCKLEHTKQSNDWTTTDQILTATTAFQSLELPSNGDTILLTFTNFINCCRFYIHIIDKKDDDYPYDVTFVNLLRELNKKENIIKYKTLEILPAVGEIVLFEDRRGVWNRGQYLGAVEKDNIGELFSVDFGTKCVCSIRNIRKIEDKFLHLPFQAVLCTLHGYREKPDIDQNEVQEFVAKNFFSKVFYADVITSEYPLSLRIFDNETILGNMLKELGYAENCQVLKPEPDSVLQLE